MSTILVYTTFPEEKTASDVCQYLLEERLIACANMMPKGASLYRWEGEVKKTFEVVVFLKTTEEVMPKLKEILRCKHPYDSPCLLSLPVSDGLPAFLSWIQAETEVVS